MVPLDPAILVILLSVGANPNIQTDNGITTLMIAAEQDYREGLQVLINAGSIVNLHDSTGFTALHSAAEQGYLTTSELLLVKGAQASLVDESGQTPLDLALIGGHDDVCRLLITVMECDPLSTQKTEHSQPVQHIPQQLHRPHRHNIRSAMQWYYNDSLLLRVGHPSKHHHRIADNKEASTND